MLGMFLFGVAFGALLMAAWGLSLGGFELDWFGRNRQPVSREPAGYGKPGTERYQR